MFFDDEFDYDYLKRRMERYLSTIRELDDLNLSVSINISNRVGNVIDCNAGVRKNSDGTYEITILKDLFSAIKHGINYYLGAITESDLDFLIVDGDSELYSNYNCFFEGDTLKDRFFNQIASLMLDNIIRHEVGHIVLGHCEEFENNYLEKDLNELSNNFVFQNREMQADWYGIFRCFVGSITFDIGDIKFDIYQWKEYALIKRLFLCSFIANYVAWAQFSGLQIEKRRKIEEYEFVNRKHACGLVRMRYCYDALINALTVVLSDLKKVNNEIDGFDYAFGMADGFRKQLNDLVKRGETYTYDDIKDNLYINFYYHVIQLQKFYNSIYWKTSIEFPVLTDEEFLEECKFDFIRTIFSTSLTKEEKGFIDNTGILNI